MLDETVLFNGETFYVTTIEGPKIGIDLLFLVITM